MIVKRSQRGMTYLYDNEKIELKEITTTSNSYSWLWLGQYITDTYLLYLRIS